MSIPSEGFCASGFMMPQEMHEMSDLEDVAFLWLVCQCKHQQMLDFFSHVVSKSKTIILLSSAQPILDCSGLMAEQTIAFLVTAQC